MARLVATVFLERRHDTVWETIKNVLVANAASLTCRQLVALIAAAQRAHLKLDRTAKVAALVVLDEFQHLAGDLSDALVPLLTVMGDATSASTCFETDGLLLVPLLTGLSLEAAKVVSGHKRVMINLEPFSDSDAFAILREVLQKPAFAQLGALLDYVAPALDASVPVEVLPVRQLCFRGLVLDCGANPSLLVHLALQLAALCTLEGLEGRVDLTSDTFLDGLFASFCKRNSHWGRATDALGDAIRALPTSLVPIVVASLPIDLHRPAVDGNGIAMKQTWSQLLSSCGLTPLPHPSFPGRWTIKMPYVFLAMLARAMPEFLQLEACVAFPYLYRSARAFENLVFKVHAQRTFHLLGASALRTEDDPTTFAHLFPGGFLPSRIADCLVRLPDATATLLNGPECTTENGWCHSAGTVDDVPSEAWTGNVYKAKEGNHYHFEGRSALLVNLDGSLSTWTNTLLLWQTKVTSTALFGLAEICDWHSTARALTTRWTDAGIHVVYVLVLFRGAETSDAQGLAANDQVRRYAEASGDLVVVTKEHMGEYLAGLAHRLYVPLESTSTGTV